MKYQEHTVITPAPSKEEGLNDRDACEPDEHMRAAIIAKAKEIGLASSDSVYNCIRIGYNVNCAVLQIADLLNNYRVIPSGEFYDRLCRMKKPEPPLVIKVGAGNNCGNWDVSYKKGRIKIGECTYVPNEDIRTIASKLID